MDTQTTVHNYVKTPTEYFFCPVCKQLLNNPYQTLCGHRLCYTCMLQFNNTICPFEEDTCKVINRDNRHLADCQFRHRKKEHENDDALPEELENDPMTRKLYEKAMQEGKEIDKTIRVMVVGCYEQGKTTLVQRLLDQPINRVESTNGIDIHRCIINREIGKWEIQKASTGEDDSMKRLAHLAKTSVNLPPPEVADLDNDYEMVDDPVVFTAEYSDSLNETSSNITIPKVVHSEPVENPSAKAGIDHLQYKMFLSELKKYGSEENVAGVTNTEYVNIWDFGGQYVFYATHQLFHSRNAIYLLVFNINEDLDTKIKDDDFPDKSGTKMKSMKEYIEFWVSSINSFVGSEDGTEPVILLVGTHKDELQDLTEVEEYFDSIREIFDGRKLLFHFYPDSYAVSATDPVDKTIGRLRAVITQLGEKEAIKHEIPAKWIPLERALKSMQHQNITTLENVLQLNQRLEYPVGSEDGVKLFLKYHHARGILFYFDEGAVSDYVVINPQYIINAFKCVITSRKFCLQQPQLRPLWKNLSQRAILAPELIEYVWSNDKENRFIEYKDVLIFFLKKHRIVAEALEYEEIDDRVELKPLGFYIVPSLMSSSDNGLIGEFVRGRRATNVCLVYIFENEAIVPTLYQRLTAAAIGTWPIVCMNGQDLLFEHAGAYKLDMNHVGLIKHKKNKIEILVVQQCPEKNVLPDVPPFFRRFVDLMIGQEFMKFQADESCCEERRPYKHAIRCFHDSHAGKGSKDLYHLENLGHLNEKIVCCPDNLGHASLCISKILYVWFKQGSSETLPKRRLSKKEYSTLSRAVGYDWQELGRNLEIDDVTLQHIEMDNLRTSMRIYEMLLTWDEKENVDATLDILVEAIRKLKPDVVNWDIVDNLVDNFY